MLTAPLTFYTKTNRDSRQKTQWWSEKDSSIVTRNISLMFGTA